MEQNELNKMKALAEAATEGPWHTVDRPWGKGNWVSTAQDPHAGCAICDCESTLFGDDDEWEGSEYANAAFIAAARSFVPAAIARIEELEAAAHPATVGGQGVEVALRFRAKRIQEQAEEIRQLKAALLEKALGRPATVVGEAGAYQVGSKFYSTAEPNTICTITAISAHMVDWDNPSGSQACINRGEFDRYISSGAWVVCPARTPVAVEGGAGLIAAERQRQMQKEGWTPEHDAEHANAELAKAAVAYILQVVQAPYPLVVAPTSWWPFEYASWKPSADPIRNLQKAGALIAAEIDRLERLQQIAPTPPAPVGRKESEGE